MRRGSAPPMGSVHSSLQPSLWQRASPARLAPRARPPRACPTVSRLFSHRNKNLGEMVRWPSIARGPKNSALEWACAL
jgi:hypothetical protein